MKRNQILAIGLMLAAGLLAGGCTFFQQTQIRYETTRYDAAGNVTARDSFVYKNPKDATAMLPAAAFVDGADPNLMASISSMNSPVIGARGDAHFQSLTGYNEVTQSVGNIAGVIAANVVTAALNSSTAKTAQMEIKSAERIRLKELEPEPVHEEPAHEATPVQ